MANRMGNSRGSDRFFFLGSKITVDDDYSQEIRRCLPLGRKAMTNLNSVLKSKDITLPTKVHRVRAMVYPVVMYRCENWTIKKAENWRIDAFELWVLEKTLESSLDCKEIKQINPKRNQPWIFTGKTDAEASILWLPHVKSQLIEKTLLLGNIEGKRRGRQRIRWWDGITDSMNMNVSKLWKIEDREAWHAGVQAWGHKESDTT